MKKNLFKTLAALVTLSLSTTAFSGEIYLSEGESINLGRRVVYCGAQSCSNPGAIEGCEAAMDGDTNELKCMSFARDYCISAHVINRCEATMDGDTNELTCIEIAGQRGLTVSDIDHCERSMAGDTRELECLRVM